MMRDKEELPELEAVILQYLQDKQSRARGDRFNALLEPVAEEPEVAPAPDDAEVGELEAILAMPTEKPQPDVAVVVEEKDDDEDEME